MVKQCLAKRKPITASAPVHIFRGVMSSWSVSSRRPKKNMIPMSKGFKVNHS